jgi:hypothetical protein
LKLKWLGTFAGALVLYILYASNALCTDRLVTGTLTPKDAFAKIVADSAFPVF